MKACTIKTQAALPIGVFDSGVGGLTVLRAVHECLPAEDLLYLGDTARLPYGTKSRETVAHYALQAAGKLVERGIKMLVVACNTATAAALPALRKAFAPLPVVGVIEPGAHAALMATKNHHIAVIATESTIAGGAYQQAITHACAETHMLVTAKACTLFVALAEEGWVDGPVVKGVAARYLSDIFLQPSVSGNSGSRSRPDTLLLGCTHFPPLSEALKAVVGDEVTLVDSAVTTAFAVKNALAAYSISHEEVKRHGTYHFMTTDDVERFARVGSLFWGQHVESCSVEHVDL